MTRCLSWMATTAWGGLAVLLVASGCRAPAPQGDTLTGEPDVDPTAVRPFEISVPEPVLVDLRTRLSDTRFPDEVGADWTYGTDLSYLRELITYWRDEFDWREQERRLNRFDQYLTEIDGLDIHFIHQRSPEDDAFPLIITHGWPGSVVEFAEIIGPLTDPTAHGGRAEDAFHVVAPSIPGYGFSDKPREPGFGADDAAEINAALMARLGYERYGAQGGDWGSLISRWLAHNYPERVAGLHLNFVTAGPPDGDDPTAGVPAAELARMRERQQFFSEERGYQAIQGTKPQTLGYGLNDSPAGLAAWIVEKFRTWSDNDGNVESAFTRDELLTNITLYWATQTITSSTRLYYEARHAGPSAQMGRIDVPTAAAIFPDEVIISPRRWVEDDLNIVRWTEMPRGGHFAALEEPDLLVDDLRAFFRDLR